MDKNEQSEVDLLTQIVSGELLYLCGTDVVNHPIGFDYGHIKKLVDAIRDAGFTRKDSDLQKQLKDMTDQLAETQIREQELARRLDAKDSGLVPYQKLKESIVELNIDQLEELSGYVNEIWDKRVGEECPEG